MNNSQIIGTCEDCLTESEVILCPACSDYHNYGNSCCQKYVCKNGCKINCHECNAINIVKNTEGYFFEQLCMACNTPLFFSFTWYGENLKESCNKYCQMNCFRNKNIMTIKTKYTDEKYNIFLDEIRYLFSIRLSEECYKLRFITIEELNKSLNFPSSKAYHILGKLFCDYIQFSDNNGLLNNKSLDVISEIWNINLY